MVVLLIHSTKNLVIFFYIVMCRTSRPLEEEGWNLILLHNSGGVCFEKNVCLGLWLFQDDFVDNQNNDLETLR